MFGRFNKKLFLILLLSVFLRLWRLGTLPISNVENPLFARLPSAFAGILSVYLLYFIVSRIFENETIALWSSLWLSTNPWHIVESRVIFPQFWFFQNLSKMNITSLFPNIFKLISFNFLFFSNDAFWWGGMRKVGVMLPLTVLPFIVGVYGLFFYKKRKVTFSIAGLLLFIIVISALNPDFPETREFLLSVPIFATFCGLGTNMMVNIIRKWKFGQILLVIGGLIFCYQFIVFWRLYTVHYRIRIESDIHTMNYDF